MEKEEENKKKLIISNFVLIILIILIGKILTFITYYIDAKFNFDLASYFIDRISFIYEIFIGFFIATFLFTLFTRDLKKEKSMLISIIFFVYASYYFSNLIGVSVRQSRDINGKICFLNTKTETDSQCLSEQKQKFKNKQEILESLKKNY